MPKHIRNQKVRPLSLNEAMVRFTRHAKVMHTEDGFALMDQGDGNQYWVDCREVIGQESANPGKTRQMDDYLRHAERILARMPKELPEPRTDAPGGLQYRHLAEPGRPPAAARARA